MDRPVRRQFALALLAAALGSLVLSNVLFSPSGPVAQLVYAAGVFAAAVPVAYLAATRGWLDRFTGPRWATVRYVVVAIAVLNVFAVGGMTLAAALTAGVGTVAPELERPVNRAATLVALVGALVGSWWVMERASGRTRRFLFTFLALDVVLLAVVGTVVPPDAVLTLAGYVGALLASLVVAAGLVYAGGYDRLDAVFG
ncbi:hypothetical protein ACFQH6_02760 [Halobacteriaceae archaeon GCM10025711]